MLALDDVANRRRGCCVALSFLVLLSLHGVDTQQCNVNGVDQFCQPVELEQAFGQVPLTSSTCGSPAGEFCYTPIGGSRTCGLTCNAASAGNRHPPEHMTDLLLLGTWWQSENNKQSPAFVDIELALPGNKTYEISYITLKFRQQRPESMVIFKSIDYGKTYSLPYQFFSYSCQETYNLMPDEAITSDMQVICKNPSTLGSAVAQDEITFRTTDDRPGKTASEIVTEELRDFVTATGVKVRLQRIQTNSTDERDLYYGVISFNVLARCKCNGHASSCSMDRMTGTVNCDCEHDTDGQDCDVCKALFNNRPWVRGMACEACQCNSHSSRCEFNQTVYEANGNKDGGVCINCQHNTAGVQCEQCATFYYPNTSMTQNNPDVCIACDCESAGVVGGNTDCARSSSSGVIIGDCNCKSAVSGRRCDVCMPEFWGLDSSNPDGCQSCGCNVNGTVGGSRLCDTVSGQCSCKANVEGRMCGECKSEHYGLNGAEPRGCSPCNCIAGRSFSNSCDKITGQCPCRPGLTGRDCSQTQPGTFLPPLDYIRYEGELAGGSATPVSSIDGVGTIFTHTGYTAAQSNDTVTFTVTVPDSRQYQIVIRYTYNGMSPWSSVQLTVVPASTVGTRDTPTCSEVTTTLTIDVVNLVAGEGVGSVLLSSLCLRERRDYVFEFKLGPSGSGNDSVFLLDSFVLLPVVNDFAVFWNDSALLTSYTNAGCVQARHTVQGGLNEDNTCRTVSMTIAAELYNGALNCTCSSDGSVNDISCNNYTGQCDCHSGVFGRTCGLCLPGHHSFSSSGCTDCSCNLFGSSSRICDPSTGQCSCRSNVDRLQCDQCFINHFGFNTTDGCRACYCNTTGSTSTQCTETGQCPCKNGITGMRCEQCFQSHYNFTDDGCTPCSCSVTGSTADSCSDDGRCSCKSRVNGRQCEFCNAGFYNLDDGNYEGCQPCFGYGRLLGCTAARGYTRATVTSEFTSVSSGWRVLRSDSGADITTVVSLVAAGGLMVRSRGINADLFLEAPVRYLGNRLSSYAQTLTISFRLLSDLPGVRPSGPDVILASSDGYNITLRLNPMPSSAFEEYVIQLDTSAAWQTQVDGVFRPATAFEMQRVLVSLNRLAIRAVYDLTVPSVFRDVVLEVAALSSLSDVTWVENSTCPVNYTGLLCESCASGYTRSLSGGNSYTQCVACDCSGHSTSCDSQTGVCTLCQDNTRGDHCELCSEGFYRNTDDECLPCPCPLTSGPGQFTKSCELQGGSVVCLDCPSGHSGDNCGQCNSGYFGNPMLGVPCSNCSCSGNINVSDPDSCNQTSGECLKCLYGTAGPLCEVCKDGFYGSAFARNCTECGCQVAAADVVCSKPNGQCICRFGAAGLKCDSCQENFFGLSSSGCQACNCDQLGSARLQCNVTTGVCSCKQGVGGDKCDQCVPAFYNFSNAGCMRCDCHPDGSTGVQCDLSTGQCPCRVGAGGLQCDSCRSGFFNVSQGCLACQCNGHSSQCDSTTGICSGCQDNTEGDYCELCSDGFFGDATGGSSTDCQPCPCPGTSPSSSFSSVCDQKLDGTALCTDCAEGHGGDRCEFCVDGYSGDPQGILSNPTACAKCVCSGNINESASGNCNNLTGICTQCLYNTAGDYCQLCADGYYGNALAQNCTACNCDPVGAVDVVCIEPDGRCFCRPNVMEPKCDKCVSGYYNMTTSGCQDCLCDVVGSQSLVCNEVSGVCQCKSGVGGDRCDRCLPGFYGFDSSGCTACGCHPSGSNSTQCDQVTGQCSCKATVTGTQCDTCLDGFFGLSAGCVVCNCNNHSTSCNNVTGVCLNCRDNTEGDHCEICSRGFYGRPSTGTPMDCQRCPCPLASNDGRFSETCQLDGTEVVCTACEMGHTGRQCENCIVGFYGDPNGWLGNPTGCQWCDCNGNVDIDVAGNCNTTTGTCSNCNDNTAGSGCERCADDYYGDAVLAKNCTACHCDINGAAAGVPCDPTTGQCSCHPFVLGRQCDVCAVNYWNKASGLGCEACDCDPVGAIGLSCNTIDGQCSCRPGVGGRRCDRCLIGYFDFSSSGCQECACFVPGSIDVSCNQTTGQCACAAGAQGLKCSVCKDFFFNATAGCLACDCNGHSVECDSITGFCMNCQHNTEGEYCGRCISGYYGDAMQGLVDDCKLCRCPGTDPATTFSSTCQLRSDGQVECTACQQGHTGLRCELCGPGFFGDPASGQTCSDCTCNGNIDPSDPGSCNRTTGECINCLYNTTGRRCEVCADGYFGNATTQSCEACQCNPGGTAVGGCDFVSGTCFCSPNVIGNLCDHCSNDFYDFGNPSGCLSCNCNSTGSQQSQCGLINGQCPCKVGVAGIQCDSCEFGFFNFNENGCTPCDCNSDGSSSLQCNDHGQCPCRFGVTGLHCDMCAENFIGNGTRCSPCGVCYDDVQAAVEELRLRLTAMQIQLAAFDETRRNDTFAVRLADAESRIRELEANVANATTTIDILWVEIRDTEGKIGALESQHQTASALSFEGQRVAVSANRLSLSVTEEVNEIQDDVTGAYNTLSNGIKSSILTIGDKLSNITALANTSSELAAEASALADVQTSVADMLSNSAALAANESAVARATAQWAWMSQETDKQRLPDVAKILSKYADDVEEARVQVVAAETASSQAALEAALVLANASSPPPDHALMELRERLIDTDQTTTDLAVQTESLKGNYSELVTNVDQKRIETTSTMQQLAALDSDAEALKQRADEGYRKALDAVSSGTSTQNAAEDMLDILQNFNDRITETSAQAATALLRVDEIRNASERSSQQARQILADHQQALANAQEAERLAEEAKSTAETAEQTATNVRKNFDSTLNTASTQKSEAADKLNDAVSLNASADSLLRSCTADSLSVNEKSRNVDVAVSNLTACDQRVDDGRVRVEQLLADIGNLDQLDMAQISSLATRIDSLEDQLKEIDLTATLALMASQLERQKQMAADHESEISILSGEVDEVKLVFQKTCT